MLSNKNTLRSSTSTLVTGSVTKSSIHFNQDDIKVIFVKSKKSNRKASIYEKKVTQEEDDSSIFKPILRSNRKYTQKSGCSVGHKYEMKRVRFCDEQDNISESSRKNKIAEIYIVPSYKNFYNKVYVDEDNEKVEKIGCKCACIIF
jgi:hypothetical protein